ncbi:MAG: LuxR C-terminal-related transcriptional regulator [Armatimonadota bacterium]|nr:LuxR C-terminal-related transcriptional regulator [Armatimonadota bacterium]
MATLELGNHVEHELASLSERERSVLNLAVKGYKDRAISEKLGIAKGTVGTYWNRIRRKLGPLTRAEIAAIVGRVEGRDSNVELTSTITRLAEVSRQLEEETARRRAAERYLQLLRRLALGVARYSTNGRRLELVLGRPELFSLVDADPTSFAAVAQAVDGDGEARNYGRFRVIGTNSGDVIVAITS